MNTTRITSILVGVGGEEELLFLFINTTRHMRWINETRGKVVCLLLHSSEYCRQLIYDKLCTLKHGHSHFKRAQIPKSERVRENRPRRSRRPWPTFAWEEMSHHPRGKWFSRALGAYSRTSTNGHLSTLATFFYPGGKSIHWLLIKLFYNRNGH